MPGKGKRGWGKGYRSSACIGRRQKNWKKKASKVDTEVLPNVYMEDSNDGGSSAAEIEEKEMSCEAVEEEEMSWEVPKDSEDVVAEIVADLDDSTDAVSTCTINDYALCVLYRNHWSYVTKQWQ